jgi:RNA polymerase sigma factor (sigma-70 family)
MSFAKMIADMTHEENRPLRLIKRDRFARDVLEKVAGFRTRLPENDLPREERERLFLTCRKMAAAVAVGVMGQHHSETPAVENEALLGIWKAACFWQKSMAARFSTYAAWWAYGYADHYRRWWLSRTRGLASLDVPAAHPDGVQFRDLILESERCARHVNREIPPDVGADVRLTLRPALAKLGERDRIILELEFFQSMNLTEIGDKLGLSRERVRQLSNRAMKRLRRIIGVEPPERYSRIGKTKARRHGEGHVRTDRNLADTAQRKPVVRAAADEAARPAGRADGHDRRGEDGQVAGVPEVA